MSRNGYHGGVREIVTTTSSPPGVVLGLLEERAGTKAYEGQVIMMKVAGPVRLRALPRGCVSRVPGTY
jgi:hypothetical protein